MIPPNPLKDYVARYGEEEVSRRLSLALGKKIGPTMVRMNANVTSRRPPITWLAALGLDTSAGGSHENPPAKPIRNLPRQPFPSEPTPPSGSEGEPPDGGAAESAAADDGARRAEQAPTPPDDAEFAFPPRAGLPIQAAAKERIAALHVFAGSAIATAADADGFEHDRGVGGGIGKLWSDRSDDIAEAWIQWAEEGNRFAQSFVRLMASGGAGGSLALGYAALLGGTAYIMGSMPDNEATRVIYGKYSRYRTVVPTADQPAGEPERPPDQQGGRNGAAADSAADHLGDVAGAPGF